MERERLKHDCHTRWSNTFTLVKQNFSPSQLSVFLLFLHNLDFSWVLTCYNPLLLSSPSSLHSSPSSLSFSLSLSLHSSERDETCSIRLCFLIETRRSCNWWIKEENENRRVGNGREKKGKYFWELLERRERERKKKIEQCQNQRYFHCGKVQNEWRLCVTRHPISHYCFSLPLPLSLFLPLSLSLSSFPATECNRKWMQFTQDICTIWCSCKHAFSYIQRNGEGNERERKEEKERKRMEVRERELKSKYKREQNQKSERDTLFVFKVWIWNRINLNGFTIFSSAE